MTTPITVYRRSELEGSDCLFRYKAVWLDGVDDSSDYALRGQAFAAIKFHYITGLLAAQLGQDEEIAQQAFIDGIASSRCPDRLIPEVNELWMRHARNFELPLDRYVTHEEKQDPVLCAGCRRTWTLPELHSIEGPNHEKHWSCPSCGSTQLELRPFTFTPDLVLSHPERNELEVVDDKTFFVALTAAQAKASFQGRFYIRHAMSRWPNYASYRFTFAFVRLGKVESVVYTSDDLEALDREVASAVKKIELARQTNHWPATPGPSCNYCELQCPVVDNLAVVPKRVSLPAQASALGAAILAASKWVSTAKKTLKGYCATEGAVDVNGVEWDNRPVENRWYPIRDVIQVLQDRGRMGAFESEELTLSYSALSKLFKAYPDLEKDLAGVQRAKTTYRFSAKKPGVGDDDDDQ